MGTKTHETNKGAPVDKSGETTKDVGASAANRGIGVRCDYRADMKNGKIGMVLESAGLSIDLGVMYAKSPNIMMFDRSHDSEMHRVKDVDTVYVQVNSLGGIFVLRKDGTIDHVNEVSSNHPITEAKLRPRELENVSLEVGKPMPGELSPGSELITCIVAVPSRTYDEGQVERRTHGRVATFALKAERLIKSEAQLSGSS